MRDQADTHLAYLLLQVPLLRLHPQVLLQDDGLPGRLVRITAHQRPYIALQSRLHSFLAHPGPMTMLLTPATGSSHSTAQMAFLGS